MTDALKAVSPLRRRMIDDMSLRNLSPATQRSYLHAVTKFSRYSGRSPDRLGLEDVRAFPPPVARRNRKLQHLGNRVAVNAKPPRRFPPAQSVYHHSASDPGIEFHCKHPSSPSMPVNDIKSA